MKVWETDLIADLRDDVLNAGPLCEVANAELFTGPNKREHTTARILRESKAKAVCSACLARIACLAYALRVQPQVGVWAGFTADELRRYRRTGE